MMVSSILLPKDEHPAQGGQRQQGENEIPGVQETVTAEEIRQFPGRRVEQDHHQGAEDRLCGTELPVF